MAKLAQFMGYRALTASLDVRFKDVAKTGDPLHITAEVTKLTKKIIFTKSVVRGESGKIMAEAHAKLMVFC